MMRRILCLFIVFSSFVVVNTIRRRIELPPWDIGFEPKVKYDRKMLKKKLEVHQYQMSQFDTIEAKTTGIYDKHFEPGKYHCIVCNQPLFKSEDKYDVNWGQATFKDTIGELWEKEQHTFYVSQITFPAEIERTRVKCLNCGANMGHVQFVDDPESDTGRRYTINSASLNFVPE